jgi:DNA-binding CsgD family transcriptional regulator
MSRLNEAERAVLRLLAEGHTAKSIAAMIGSTTAAVNERLREARRKTGVGSSRELARLLKAQETCDEQIGISSASAAEAPSSRRSFLQRKGAVAMVFIVAIAATAALISAQPDKTEPAPQIISDPDLGTFTLAGPSWLYKTVRQEPRDDPWASRAEKALRDRYQNVLFFDEKARVLRVTCRTMTCEVAASWPAGKPGRSYGEGERSIVADMRKQGLVQNGASITGDQHSDRGIYIAYFIRSDG